MLQRDEKLGQDWRNSHDGASHQGEGEPHPDPSSLFLCSFSPRFVSQRTQSKPTRKGWRSNVSCTIGSRFLCPVLDLTAGSFTSKPSLSRWVARISALVIWAWAVWIQAIRPHRFCLHFDWTVLSKPYFQAVDFLSGKNHSRTFTNSLLSSLSKKKKVYYLWCHGV